MTGLLIKDWKLLKNQGRFFVLVLIFTLFFLIVGASSYTGFMTSYMTFVFSIFVLSTLSYDSYDNGMAFLMALPVSRKIYIKEKYVFGLLLIFGSWLLTMFARQLVYCLSISPVDNSGLLQIDLIYLFIVLLFIAYSLPVRIKFGAEKGQMISFCTLGVFAFSIFFLARSPLFREKLLVVLSVFLTSSWKILGGMFLLCAVIWCISYKLSVKILEKQEF
ncbi:MAG: ABC-2 transporter permease [Lachnospiraceae bacterium]|jgi:ABC-2 type transport system permease protein|nr:ABC-2 transporter permease [Lachnospiraceae bacterium]